MRSKRVLLIFIIILVIGFTAFSFFRESSKKKQDVKNIGNISQQSQDKSIDPLIKKDIEDGIKKAQEENQRQRKLEEYLTPSPGSTAPDPSNINEKTKYNVMVDNVFLLYKSKCLNIDQFIYVEENLNKGIDDFTKVILFDNEKTERYYYENKDKIEKQYKVNNLDNYLKLKNLVSQAGNIKKVSIDEASIVKKEEFVSFKITVTGTAKALDIPVTVEIKGSVDDIKIKWST